MLYIVVVSKNFNKDMKFFLHFSLQIKNIVLILHRQKQTMGYGVMVTLQILVLSFLVRIQVAQLKRSSQEGRFFVLYAMGIVVGGARCALVVFESYAPMQASCKK